MPRVTKAELENTVKELETQLEEQRNHYLDLLNKEDERYNKLVNEKEGQFHSLPEYQRMQKEIEQLETQKKANEHYIDTKREENATLKNRIQELLVENEQLKESIKNQVTINDTIHNARGAGRKPKPIEKIQEQVQQIQSRLASGQKEKYICTQMKISRSTYYRLKRLL